MKKKIMGIALAVVMLFATIGLTACNTGVYQRPNLNINAELELAIRQTAYENYLLVYEQNGWEIDFDINDVRIVFYYGTYNKTSVVLMEGIARGGQAETTVTISGLNFTFRTTNIFRAWRNGNFYSVQQSYDNGWLTRSQLRTIRVIHLEK